MKRKVWVSVACGFVLLRAGVSLNSRLLWALIKTCELLALTERLGL